MLPPLQQSLHCGSIWTARGWTQLSETKCPYILRCWRTYGSSTPSRRHGLWPRWSFSTSCQSTRASTFSSTSISASLLRRAPTDPCTALISCLIRRVRSLTQRRHLASLYHSGISGPAHATCGQPLFPIETSPEDAMADGVPCRCAPP